MDIPLWFKRSHIVHTMMGIIFLLSGFLINFCQLLSCVVWPLSKPLYRRINVFLMYMSWAQIVWMADSWSGSTCQLYTELENLKYFGKESAIVILNHSYDIDWLMGWVICDRFNVLGSSKVFLKKMLKYVPIIGWSWTFAECVFLERNWDKDKKAILDQMKNLCDYPVNIWVLLFCEGTRFTPDKHKASLEYARKHGQPELRHLLLPRTKGFVTSVQGFKDKIAAVYDVTVAFPKNGNKPVFKNIVNGVPCHGHMKVFRHPMADIPTDTEEATSQWLKDIYVRKDKLLDKFADSGEFDGDSVDPPRSWANRINMALWTLLIAPPVLYACLQVALYGPWLTKIIVSSFLLAVYVTVKLMISVTDTTKSSRYGTSANLQALGDVKKVS